MPEQEITSAGIKKQQEDELISKQEHENKKLSAQALLSREQILKNERIIAEKNQQKSYSQAQSVEYEQHEKTDIYPSGYYGQLDLSITKVKPPVHHEGFFLGKREEH